MMRQNGDKCLPALLGQRDLRADRTRLRKRDTSREKKTLNSRRKDSDDIGYGSETRTGKPLFAQIQASITTDEVHMHLELRKDGFNVQVESKQIFFPNEFCLMKYLASISACRNPLGIRSEEFSSETSRYE